MQNVQIITSQLGAPVSPLSTSFRMENIARLCNGVDYGKIMPVDAC